MNRVASTVIASLLLLAGCHSHYRGPVDSTLPTASITFPSMKSFTSAATTRLTGTAADSGGIRSVRINGQDAISTDGFATWSIDVPLTNGDNVLTVVVTDNAGNVANAAATTTIERRAEFQNASGGELNAAGDRMYFVDSVGKSIRMLTLSDGAVVDVADLSRFATTPIAPLDLALDLANNRIYLGVRENSGSGAATIGIWAYNTQDHTWSAFSDAQTANGGPALSNPTDLVLDAQAQKLYVLDWSNGVYAIDTATGVRTLLSSNTVPSAVNPLFVEPMDAVLDAANNRLLVIDRGSDALFAVDLASGARTLISQAGAQAGPDFSYPLSMVYSPVDNKAYVFDGSVAVQGGTALLGVDLATGNRSIAQSQADLPTNSPTDLQHADVRDMVLAGQDIIAIDTQYSAATRVTFSPNQRTRVSNNSFPRNRDQQPSYDTVLANGKVYRATANAQLLETDGNGVERTVAGATVPGSAALTAYRLAIDAVNNVAYAVTYTAGFGSVSRVNLANGTITMVTDGSVTSGGGTLGWISDLVLDATGSKLYALTSDGVVEITIATGARQVAASPPGNDPAGLLSPSQFALDTTGNRLIIGCAGKTSLIALDLATGIYSEFSDSGASGAPFTAVEGVAVDGDGSIWAIDAFQKLVHVDRTTGARTPVSATTGSGTGYGSGSVLYPVWYRLQRVGGGLFIQDAGMNLLQVEPASGTRVAVATGLPGSN